MEWICKECGSYNDGAGLKCAVCGASRPEELQCVCPECKNYQRAFPGMRCEKCDYLFTEEDFPTLRPDPRPVPPPEPVPPPRPYPPGPGPVPPPGPAEERKRPSSAVIIAVTAIIVVGALAALLILKYFGQDRPAVNSGNAQTETAAAIPAGATGSALPAETSAAATSTAAAPGTSSPVFDQTVYNPVLDIYYEAIASGGTFGTEGLLDGLIDVDNRVDSRDAFTGVSEVMIGQGDNLDKAAYTVNDIDGDGTGELFILDPDRSRVLNMYTWNGSRPVLLVTGWERNRYYALTDGRIYNEGSGGAQYNMSALYDYSRGIMTFSEGWFTYPTDSGELGYYHTYKKEAISEGDLSASERLYFADSDGFYAVSRLIFEKDARVFDAKLFSEYR